MLSSRCRDRHSTSQSTIATGAGRPPRGVSHAHGLASITIHTSDHGLSSDRKAAASHRDGRKPVAVTNVVADELRTQMEKYDTLRPGRQGLEDFVRVYLSPEHRDQPNTGCPSAALLDEIGRCADVTKQAYTEGATAIVEEIAARLAPADPQSARGKAIGLFTMMVRTLQLSRALADRKFADEVLERGIENAHTFLD
ncbi:TetR/AcrR family transcriptional regulator [Streptomyces sp. NPDC058676]|uniref:TetR/AcrR family transcriptional regulator n=1 Tax=unclassified Streptomyces TaxID=2593676 RepID=UPI003650BF7F